MVDPLWVDNVAGSPAYSAAELRRTLGALLYRDNSLKYSARPGMLRLSNVNPVTISGMTVTVADVAVVLSPNDGDPKDGSYIAAITQATLPVSPADGALPRKDVIVARMTGGNTSAICDIIAGTPASSPTEPPHTGMVRLATVDIPAGSTTPTVTNNAWESTTHGGILRCNGVAFYPDENAYEGMYVDDYAANALVRYGGTQWQTVASPTSYNGGLASSAADGNTVTADNNQGTKDTWASLSGGPSVTVDVGPSGKVKLTFGAQATFPTDTNTGRLAQLRVTYTGANTGNTSGDDWEMRNQPVGFSQAFTSDVFLKGLAQGSTTFTLQCYHTADTGGCTWAQRKLIVEPK